MRVLSLIFTIILIQSSCKGGEKGVEERVEFFCDAEKLSENGKLFISNNVEFKNGNAQSEDFAHSGKFSVKLNKDSQYGLGFTIEDVHPGEAFHVSVWRKSTNGKGALVIVGDTKGFLFYAKENIATSKDENGWEKLSLSFIAPISNQSKDYKLYVYNPNKNYVYFDDLKIIRTSNRKNKEGINITLEQSVKDSLISLRNKAFKNKVITKSLKQKLPTKFKVNGDELKSTIRLKGDWTDHLRQGKWSVRINIKDDKEWNNISTLSVSSPKTRYFLHEWYFHKLLEQEGILTTDYGFTPLSLNNTYMGIYSYEEHFEEKLLTKRGRKTGPILKIQENAVFEQSLLVKKTKSWPQKPFYAAAEILPFNKKKVKKDKEFRAQFLIAQDLLYHFKSGQAEVSEIFDLSLLAKYAAIVDVCKAFHARQWHNLRFYYNPNTKKLEPIGYDGFRDILYPEGYLTISGFQSGFEFIKKAMEDKFYHQIFTDSIFVNEYIKNLELFSSEKFIQKFQKSIKKDLVKNTSLLKTDYPSLPNPITFMNNNGKEIRDELPKYKLHIKNKKYKVDGNLMHDSKHYNCEKASGALLNTIALKAFWNEETKEILLYNFHCKPLNVTHVSKSKKPEKFINSKHTITNSSQPKWDEAQRIKVDEFMKYVVVNYEGENILFKVYKWRAPLNK